MKTIQTPEQEQFQTNYEQDVWPPKPMLEGVRIVRDGRLDKINEVRRVGKFLGSCALYVAYKTTETVVDTMDELRVEYDKLFDREDIVE